MKKIFDAVVGFFTKMFVKRNTQVSGPTTFSDFGESYFAEKDKTEWQVEVTDTFVVPNAARKQLELVPGTYTLTLIPARHVENKNGTTKIEPAKLQVVGHENVAPVAYWRANVLRNNLRIIS